jgi:hypothetical protein
MSHLSYVILYLLSILAASLILFISGELGEERRVVENVLDKTQVYHCICIELTARVRPSHIVFKNTSHAQSTNWALEIIPRHKLDQRNCCQPKIQSLAPTVRQQINPFCSVCLVPHRPANQ